MNKTKINYWVDVAIAIAFIVSAISGLVFLLPLTTTSVLGMSFAVWDQLHIWGSLTMIGGVLAHLALHWKWVVTMTRKIFAGSGQTAKNRNRPQAKREVAPQGVTAVTSAPTHTNKQFNRREFLQYAGAGVIAVGATAVTYKLFTNSDSQTADTATAAASTSSDSAATTSSDSAATTTTTTSIPLVVQNTSTGSVACRKGKVYDAYPGSCHDYIDLDGDGYCDYSLPA